MNEEALAHWGCRAKNKQTKHNIVQRPSSMWTSNLKNMKFSQMFAYKLSILFIFIRKHKRLDWRLNIITLSCLLFHDIWSVGLL